jgi:hypothetical protein
MKRVFSQPGSGIARALASKQGTQNKGRLKRPDSGSLYERLLMFVLFVFLVVVAPIPVGILVSAFQPVEFAI